MWTASRSVVPVLSPRSSVHPEKSSVGGRALKRGQQAVVFARENIPPLQTVRGVAGDEQMPAVRHPFNGNAACIAQPARRPALGFPDLNSVSSLRAADVSHVQAATRSRDLLGPCVNGHGCFRASLHVAQPTAACPRRMEQNASFEPSSDNWGAEPGIS
jgi:hypothetical protein